MLDFLVPDELKCFQWLVGDGIVEKKLEDGSYPGPKEVEKVAKKVLSRIVPALSRSMTLLRPVFMLT